MESMTEDGNMQVSHMKLKNLELRTLVSIAISEQKR
jgi:hypothetical protein